jgi:DNA-binding beta-propeller fold protein YncE
VFDVATRSFTRIDGFKTAEVDIRGKKRKSGPSAVTVGDGVIYIGNRASSEVCVVDRSTLRLGSCVKIPVATDGVAYVAATKEVWVTTPRDRSLTVLDASNRTVLKPKQTIKLDGETEGYAVDDDAGVFFTNLEDKDKTVAIDAKTHAIKSVWSAGCGTDGPRGVAVDAELHFVFVACTDHVQVLDAAHDGAPLGKLDTGAGLDNLDYLRSSRLLYAAAGKAARLTVAHVEKDGRLTTIAIGATAEGARNAVAGPVGDSYVVDARGARLLDFPSPLPEVKTKSKE